MELGYWDIRGLAQQVRLVLEYMGVKYEDKRFSLKDKGDGTYCASEWLDVKFTMGLPFPNLPYLIDGDVKLVQSRTILRYLGRKAKLYGFDDPTEDAKVDMVIDVIGDLQRKFGTCFYNQNKEEHAKQMDDLRKIHIPAVLKQLEEFLPKDGWVLGKDKLSIADFVVGEYMDIARMVMDSDKCFADYPKVDALYKAFFALDAIKAYRASDRYIERPLNNKMASFK